jgi:hypothetical protein
MDRDGVMDAFLQRLRFVAAGRNRCRGDPPGQGPEVLWKPAAKEMVDPVALKGNLDDVFPCRQ